MEKKPVVLNTKVDAEMFNWFKKRLIDLNLTIAEWAEKKICEEAIEGMKGNR